jgi:hypothetical protein
MTSGTRLGDVRAIRYNNTTEIHWNKYDMGSADGISTSDDFKICKPSTNLNTAGLEISCSGQGSVIVQRITLLEAGGKIWSESCEAKIILTHIIMEADNMNDYDGIDLKNCRHVEFEQRVFSADGYFLTNSVSMAGVSNNNEQSVSSFNLNNINNVTLDGVNLNQLKIINCGIGSIKGGSLFQYVADIVNSRSIKPYNDSSNECYSFENTDGYAITEFQNYNSLSVYFKISNSNIGILNLEVSNSGSDGIELLNSTLLIVDSGTLGGTSNLFLGVHANTLSTVLVNSNASALTITGSSGDAGSLVSSQTWANIQSGTPNIDTSYLSVVREYTS